MLRTLVRWVSLSLVGALLLLAVALWVPVLLALVVVDAVRRQQRRAVRPTAGISELALPLATLLLFAVNPPSTSSPDVEPDKPCANV